MRLRLFATRLLLECLFVWQPGQWYPHHHFYLLEWIHSNLSEQPHSLGMACHCGQDKSWFRPAIVHPFEKTVHSTSPPDEKCCVCVHFDNTEHIPVFCHCNPGTATSLVPFCISDKLFPRSVAPLSYQWSSGCTASASPLTKTSYSLIASNTRQCVIGNYDIHSSLTFPVLLGLVP